MTDTLPEFLLHWAERTPDRIFLGEPDRRAHTYGQVAGAVAGFRGRLRGWLQMYREYDLDRAAKHVEGMVHGVRP
jgi:hypothetical protein